MRDRRRPLNVPSGFSPIDGMPDHYLMRPRSDIVGRVLAAFLEGGQSAVERASEGETGALDMYEISAGADCFGLAIGFLLFHPRRQIELRPDDVGDDREAGRMIYAELQASGYTDEQIRVLGEAAFGAVISERTETPTAADIEARVGNGPARA